MHVYLNIGSIKSERTSPIFIQQSKNSAFKPIYHQNDNNKHSHEMPFTTSTPELCKKSSKSLLINNNRDDSSSSSSTISSSSISTGTLNKTIPTIPTAPLPSNPLMHPFYIDKIFNFQNMFLFSNSGAANNNNSNTINSNANEAAAMASNQASNLLSQTSNDLQNMMHHSLLQGFYNYYNTSSLLINNIENKVTIPKVPNESNLTNESKLNRNSSVKSSFSIDSILGGRKSSLSKPSTEQIKPDESFQASQQQNLKTQNFDYWTLYAAHQYFSQVRTQTQSATHLHLQNPMNKIISNSYLSSPDGLSQVVNKNEHSQAKILNKNNKQTTTTTTSTPFSSNLLQGSHINANIDKKFDPLMNKEQIPSVKSKNAKKYKCDLCGRGFSRSNTLITHRVSLFFSSPFLISIPDSLKRVCSIYSCRK